MKMMLSDFLLLGKCFWLLVDADVWFLNIRNDEFYQVPCVSSVKIPWLSGHLMEWVMPTAACPQPTWDPGQDLTIKSKC